MDHRKLRSRDFFRFRVLAAALLALAGAHVAHAQWSVTVLHPAGTLESRAMASVSGQQAGWASVAGFHHAGHWTSSAGSWVDLAPAGSASSEALALDGGIGGQQAGWANVGGTNRASLWTGTAASWVDIHPAGSTNSRVLAVGNNQQAGWAYISGAQHASLWTGTSGSWVDLNPAGSATSRVYAISGNQQVGYATFGSSHAGIWTGSAGSFVDLHPPTGVVHSFAFAIGDGQQAGYVRIGVTAKASFWTGTAASRVELHDPVWKGSWALAVGGGSQAGWYIDGPAGSARHAVLWNSTFGSWVDLHTFLPPEFTSTSEATGIYTDGTDLFITGFAFNTTTNRNEALLWSSAGACYADCDGSGGLNILDYICFGDDFAAGGTYADCDGSGTLNILDYICFGDTFAAGCP